MLLTNYMMINYADAKTLHNVYNMLSLSKVHSVTDINVSPTI